MSSENKYSYEDLIKALRIANTRQSKNNFSLDKIPPDLVKILVKKRWMIAPGIITAEGCDEILKVDSTNDKTILPISFGCKGEQITSTGRTLSNSKKKINIADK